jgi:hypothetical protein
MKMCLLLPQAGPCRGDITMYYFDPSKRGCKKFNWGGCQGNGNRFNTRAECEAACLTTIDTPRKYDNERRKNINRERAQIDIRVDHRHINRPTKRGKEKSDGHCQCKKEMDDQLLACL